MEDILYTAKQAHKFRGTELTVSVINCPICGKDGFSITQTKFCSVNCATRVQNTLEWIKENNYATIGDFMGIDDNTFPIMATNMNEISMTINPNPESYFYSIDVNGYIIRIDDVKIPYRKH
jgi:endogenous inhibitor of DNA gyrase (YacG/DUF329 family)